MVVGYLPMRLWQLQYAMYHGGPLLVTSDFSRTQGAISLMIFGEVLGFIVPVG